MLTKIFGKN